MLHSCWLQNHSNRRRQYSWSLNYRKIKPHFVPMDLHNLRDWMDLYLGPLHLVRRLGTWRPQHLKHSENSLAHPPCNRTFELAYLASNHNWNFHLIYSITNTAGLRNQQQMPGGWNPRYSRLHWLVILNSPSPWDSFHWNKVECLHRKELLKYRKDY